MSASMMRFVRIGVLAAGAGMYLGAPSLAQTADQGKGSGTVQSGRAQTGESGGAPVAAPTYGQNSADTETGQAGEGGRGGLNGNSTGTGGEARPGRNPMNGAGGQNRIGHGAGGNGLWGFVGLLGLFGWLRGGASHSADPNASHSR